MLCSILCKKNRILLTIVVWLINIVCYIPLLYLAPIDRATGDDWWYGELTHRAWVNTHNIFEVIKAACQVVKEFYYSWQGTWFSIFLFSFQPEVFSHKAYWITPIIMLIITILCVSYFLHYCLVTRLGISIYDYLLFDGILLFLLIQFPHSSKSALFWYNGTIHYVVPFCLALCSIVFCAKFITDGKTKHLLFSSVFMTLLGGMSYLSAFLAPLVIFFFLAIDFVEKRKIRKRYIYLMIPLMLEAIGLIISATAPGNRVRGGEQYEVTLARASDSIIKSFAEATSDLFSMVKESPLIVAKLLILCVLVWVIMEEYRFKYSFRYPIFVLLYSFSVYSLIHWPSIFSGVGGISGGVFNTIFYTYILGSGLSIFWVVGWLNNYFHKQRDIDMRYHSYINGALYFVVLIAIIIAFTGKGNIKKTVTWVSIVYIRTGAAYDYKEQMDEFTEILTQSSDRDVIVPPMNWYQGPFMHYCVTDDPNEWTNQIVAAFFDKDSVVSKSN